MPLLLEGLGLPEFPLTSVSINAGLTELKCHPGPMQGGSGGAEPTSREPTRKEDAVMHVYEP